jgi:hypothetical protein
MPPLDDSPYPRHPPEQHGTGALRWLALVVLLVVCAAAYYFWSGKPPEPKPPARAQTPAANTPAPAQPALRHPLDTARADQAAPLPALDQSDASLWQALADLLGPKALAELLRPEQIVRHIVATVDNLPRESAASRVMPLTRTPGAFVIRGKDGDAVIDPGNSARYASRIRVLQSIDARRLVDLYLRFYPLFQKAYAELGYPERYFNDRLIEALDDLLAAPDIMTPIKLVQPKVQYRYADSALEARSAGQKIMLRIGVGNAGLVKAKLREIRREILSRAPKQ